MSGYEPTGYEPRFDIDNKFGQRGEARVVDMIEALRNGDVRVEVKTKRRYIDDWVYIELKQDPGGTGTRWKPSGLNVTKSEVWAYVIGDTVLFIPTDRLRWAIAKGIGNESKCVVGDNPTSGWLLRIASLYQAIADDQRKAA